VEDQSTARATKDGSAGQDLSTQGGRFAIARQTRCTLEFCEQIEEQQHSSEGRLGGEEFLHAKAVCSQIMLQLGDAILHVGSPIVIAPHVLSGLGLTGGENAKGVTRNVNQFAPHAVTRFTHTFAYGDEMSLGLPIAEAQAELTDGVILIQLLPLLDALRRTLHPLGHTCDYNVGQTALFQKAEQLVIEEA
jgi:hypothetical protein